MNKHKLRNENLFDNFNKLNAEEKDYYLNNNIYLNDYWYMVEFIIKYDFQEPLVLKLIKTKRSPFTKKYAFTYFFKLQNYWSADFIKQCLPFLSCAKLSDFYFVLSDMLVKYQCFPIESIIKLYGIDPNFDITMYAFFTLLAINKNKLNNNGIVEHYLNLLNKYVLSDRTTNFYLLNLLKNFNISKEVELKIIDLVIIEGDYISKIDEYVIYNREYWSNKLFCNRLGVSINE